MGKRGFHRVGGGGVGDEKGEGKGENGKRRGFPMCGREEGGKDVRKGGRGREKDKVISTK